MSPKLQPVRGTHDILPEEFKRFHAIVSMARDLAKLYGFQEMATPIFEATEVFARSMGETSDVVSKEMFSFETKGGEGVTLRPEFTAGIVRAFISNGMQQHLPLKLFSTGPLFRYERPQKGRQRQFHQVNFEWLGDDNPEIDVEIMSLAGQLLYSLSGEKGCTLHINTLGDKASRDNYRKALVDYLTPYASQLSEDSQRRLASNPLRILDSKDANDKKIIESAPKIMDHLSESSRQRFDKVCASLNKNVIKYFQNVVINPSLVRGLDYYCDTVFEFIAETGELGAQNTVLAGGRYDGLIEQMGGKSVPAIGFAAGVERLLLLSEGRWIKVRDNVKIMILPYEDIIESVVHNIASVLRGELHDLLEQTMSKRELSVEIAWSGSIKKRMERASKNDATHVVLLPSEEMGRRACVIKDMRTGNQQEVPVNKLSDHPALTSLFLKVGA